MPAVWKSLGSVVLGQLRAAPGLGAVDSLYRFGLIFSTAKGFCSLARYFNSTQEETLWERSWRCPGD